MILSEEQSGYLLDRSWRTEKIALHLGAAQFLNFLPLPFRLDTFGYDPHFWLAALGKTAAELSAAEKNFLSHRGQALRTLVEKSQ